MRSLINARPAAWVLLAALALLEIFHILVLAEVLPPGVVWGGREPAGGATLVGLEVFALALTALFGFIVAVRAGLLPLPRLQRAAAVGMWIVFAYFCLNVLGNLASNSTLERIIFVPVTVILALLAFRLAIEGEEPASEGP